MKFIIGTMILLTAFSLNAQNLINDILFIDEAGLRSLPGQNFILPLPADNDTLVLTVNTGELFTEMYKAHNILNNPQINVSEPANYTTLHIAAFPTDPFQYTLRASRILREYFKKNGSLELYLDPKIRIEDYVFFPALGSTPIINALIYAIANFYSDQQFLVVEQIPFFSGHAASVTNFKYPNVTFQPYRNPDEVKPLPGQKVIEFVTSPNNPNGDCRKPNPLINADIILADFAFAVPAYGRFGDGCKENNLEWIREARDAGKLVYSFGTASKQFGKTGERVGYIWLDFTNQGVERSGIKTTDIFPFFANFIAAGGFFSSQAGYLFLDTISALTTNRKANRSIFRDLNATINERQRLLEVELKDRYGDLNVELVSVPGSPTAFFKFSNIPFPANQIFQDTNTYVSNGLAYGEDSSFVRINLTGPSFDMATFLNRLANKPHKYSPEEVFFSSAHKCECRIITHNQSPYDLTPGNCQLNVDTSDGDVIIRLVDFTSFTQYFPININKISKDCNKVFIQSEEECTYFTSGSQSYFWEQTGFFERGKWKKLLRDDEDIDEE